MTHSTLKECILYQSTCAECMQSMIHCHTPSVFIAVFNSMPNEITVHDVYTTKRDRRAAHSIARYFAITLSVVAQYTARNYRRAITVHFTQQRRIASELEERLCVSLRFLTATIIIGASSPSNACCCTHNIFARLRKRLIQSARFAALVCIHIRLRKSQSFSILLVH